MKYSIEEIKKMLNGKVDADYYEFFADSSSIIKDLIERIEESQDELSISDAIKEQALKNEAFEENLRKKYEEAIEDLQTQLRDMEIRYEVTRKLLGASTMTFPKGMDETIDQEIEKEVERLKKENLISNHLTNSKKG